VNVASLGLRRLAYAGARYGPRPLVRYSPSLFGALFALLLPEQRRRVRRNLRALGASSGAGDGSESVKVVRTFVEYAHCLAESLGAERPEAATTRCEILGVEHFDAVAAEGRGAILVTAHAGAWDVAARCLGRDKGVDVMVVMAREPDAGARSLQDGVRGRSGIRVAHVGSHPLDGLPVLRHLRKGGVVAIQLDREPASPGVAADLPLPGLPMRLPRGPFHLASLARVPVIPMFTRRLGYFSYEITVCPAVHVPPRAAPDAIARAVAAVARELERFLRANPTQWFHFAP
jgi:KDO2-lipid IV(A) lauroyltransferase